MFAHLANVGLALWYIFGVIRRKQKVVQARKFPQKRKIRSFFTCGRRPTGLGRSLLLLLLLLLFLLLEETTFQKRQGGGVTSHSEIIV